MIPSTVVPSSLVDAVAAASIAASAGIILSLGLLHLLLTFRGAKLHPRDPELEARLKSAQLIISRESSMWNAWVGFNASHSFGAIWFGAVYGYLALVHRSLLLGSAFLLGLGFLLLLGYLTLAKRYWFRVPFRGILLACLFYAAGLVCVWS
jgi:hypothetical protein